MRALRKCIIIIGVLIGCALVAGIIVIITSVGSSSTDTGVDPSSDGTNVIVPSNTSGDNTEVINKELVTLMQVIGSEGQMIV